MKPVHSLLRSDQFDDSLKSSFANPTGLVGPLSPISSVGSLPLFELRPDSVIRALNSEVLTNSKTAQGIVPLTHYPPGWENDCFNNVPQANGTVIGYFVGNHPAPIGNVAHSGHNDILPAGFGLHTETVNVPGLGVIHPDATLGQYEGALLIAGATVLSLFAGGILAAGATLAAALSPQESRDDFQAIYNDFQQFNSDMGVPYPHESGFPSAFEDETSAAQWIAPMAPGVDNGASETIDVGTNNNVDYADGSIGTNGSYAGGSTFDDRIQYADIIGHAAVNSSFVMNSGLNT